METFSLNTLYALTDKSGDPVIEVTGGAVTMYVWLNEPTSSPISDDYNAFESIDSAEMYKLQTVPNYVYFVQDTGTTTAIKIKGVKADVV